MIFYFSSWDMRFLILEQVFLILKSVIVSLKINFLEKYSCVVIDRQYRFLYIIWLFNICIFLIIFYFIILSFSLY